MSALITSWLVYHFSRNIHQKKKKGGRAVYDAFLLRTNWLIPVRGSNPLPSANFYKSKSTKFRHAQGNNFCSGLFCLGIFSINFLTQDKACGEVMGTNQITRDSIEFHLGQFGPETKVYLGCDSRRFRLGGRWYADDTLVVVLHDDGSKGAKILGTTVRERVFDNSPDRPAMRLMNEVYKIASMFQEFEDLFYSYHTEVHLDLNPNRRFKSSGVVSEAIGYIRGVCQLDPKLKPDAWAASFAADRYESLKAA